MKIISISRIVLLGALGLATILSSCNKVDEADSITLAEHNITFTFDDTEERTINVTTSGSWSVTDNYPEWLEVRQGSGNTLHVSVGENSGTTRRAVVTVTSGTASDELNVEQLTYSVISFSVDQLIFPAVPENPGVVDVIAVEDVEWTIDSVPEWITTTSVNDNTITLTASENTSWRMRSGELVVKSGESTVTLPLLQAGGSSTYEEFPPAGALNTKFISANGRFILGNRSSSSYVRDLQGGSIDFFGTGTGDVADDGSAGTLDLYAISDGGIAAAIAQVNGNAQQPILFDYNTRTITTLDLTGLFGGYNARGGGAFYIDASGETAVGFVSRPNAEDYEEELPSFISYAPAMWKDGVATVLAYESDIDGIGVGSCPATHISADGTRIFGYITPGYNTLVRVACYWDVDSPDEFHYILHDNPDFFETSGGYVWRTPRINGVSADGKVVTGDIVRYIEGGMAQYTPFTFNIETGDYFILGANGFSAICTSPEGVIYAVAPPSGVAEHDSYVSVNGGEMVPLEDWLLQNYALVVPTGLSVMSMSADGTKVTGYGTWDASNAQYWNPFVITL